MVLALGVGAAAILRSSIQQAARLSVNGDASKSTDGAYRDGLCGGGQTKAGLLLSPATGDTTNSSTPPQIPPRRLMQLSGMDYSSVDSQRNMARSPGSLLAVGPRARIGCFLPPATSKHTPNSAQSTQPLSAVSPPSSVTQVSLLTNFSRWESVFSTYRVDCIASHFTA